MKTSTAIRLAGGTKQALADVFAEGGARTKVTRQAVSLWADSGTIPPLRVYHLQELRPDWFKKGSKRA